MRGALVNIILGHCFGAVIAGKGQMSYISWIADGMRLDDTPGALSMFEREVSFASAVLKKRDGSGFVVYDELFHSTNPPDAIRTSELFCESFWKKKNCISIISTHVYSLAKSAPAAQVKRLCVEAQKKDNELVLSYRLKQGICELSSVDSLLKQYSLVR
jgi:DNA mismatch repair ATPase MutS